MSYFKIKHIYAATSVGIKAQIRGLYEFEWATYNSKLGEATRNLL